jgi:hypothetical protein
VNWFWVLPSNICKNLSDECSSWERRTKNKKTKNK